MDEEPRKTKADKTKSRRCATGLLKSAKIAEAPVAINDLVTMARKEFDITVAPLPGGQFGSHGDAMTQVREGVVFIIYNDDRAEVRKRFSVAHELGHLYMGHLHGSSSIDLNTENFDEIEANTFAANVLMPKPFLQKDIKQGLTPEELSKKYNVSLEAMWFQLTESGLINSLHANAR